MWVLRFGVRRKDIFWYPAPTLVQSGERVPEMYFQFTAEQRDFDTHITDQMPLLSVGCQNVELFDTYFNKV